MDTWKSIEHGREAFGDYLSAVSADAWDTRSLCDAWSVKEVVAHMLVIPTMSKGQVFGAFAVSGFNLDRMNARLVAKTVAELSTDEMVARTRASAGSQTRPPGLKLPGVLSELVIHSADVSEAVGSPFELPLDDYVASLEHLKGVQPVFGCKQRIAGLELKATDAAWSTGEGPVVEGTAKQLLLAMTGRKAALDKLTGEGVATLRSR